MNIFDQIWSRLVKVGSFSLGMLIMYHEAFKDHSDRPYLYAAAIAMMGLQIAETVEKLAAGLGSRKNTGVGTEDNKPPNSPAAGDKGT